MKSELEMFFNDGKEEKTKSLSVIDSRKLSPNYPTEIVDFGCTVIKVRNVILVNVNEVEEKKSRFFMKPVLEFVGYELKAVYIDEFDNKKTFKMTRRKENKKELFDAAAILKKFMRTDYYDYVLANFKNPNFDYE